jgi:hypothetical protein
MSDPERSAKKMISKELSAWPLHDAVLEEVRVDWKAATCVADITTANGKKKIEWSEVSGVTIPRHEPWGPSVCIDAMRHEEGVYIIQMQSGDVIRINAASADLR